MIVSVECKENYLYKVYGLNVESEIILPQLMILDKSILDDNDVTISIGIVPDNISNPKIKLENYQISDNEMSFYIRGISRYYIANGNRIIVQPDENASIEDVKTFLLGSAFGVLLIQRNIVAIHGGAVMIFGKSVIITGNMGAGKSTLTSALRVSGHSFLADDVSVIGISKEGLPVVNPGYPQQKLCGDAMLKFGYSKSNFKMINSDRDKFALPVHEDFVENPISLGAIIELTVEDVDRVKVIEIKGSKKLKIIYENIYRIEFIKDVGLKQAYYMNYIKVVKNVPLYRIIRPRDIFSVEQQVELILKLLQN